MSVDAVSLLGVGCVTPFGNDWATVREKLSRGEPPGAEMLAGPPGCAALPAYLVPRPFEFEHPRLRRSSAISHFACAAASTAVERAGGIPAGRTALVFAASDGGVVYTRRFHEEVIRTGNGSPLLFPETVYNAPASHVAAALGIDGSVLTVVGDSAAGVDALATASDLIRSGEADRCVVVASQEIDWIVCEGYRRWKLAAAEPGDRLPILSEGAIAFVIGPQEKNAVSLVRAHVGIRQQKGSSAAADSERIFRDLCGSSPPDLVVSPDAGPAGSEKPGFLPDVRRVFPKRILGEAFAASTFLQCACACEEISAGSARSAFVLVEGWFERTGAVFDVNP